MEGELQEKADIGLVGLAVMGQNLILNMNDHGFVVIYCFFRGILQEAVGFRAISNLCAQP